MSLLPFQIHSSDMMVQHIAQRWRREYEAEFSLVPEYKLVYEKLLMLSDNPTAAEIDAIIGNRSWTVEYCSGCHQAVPQWIEFINYLGISHALCQDCVTRMHTLFTTHRKDTTR